MKKNTTSFLLQDIAIIALSILVAIILVNTQVLTTFLESTQEYRLLGTFIAGMFFTSVFTTVPALTTLGQIMEFQNIVVTAIVGAAGAVVGDLIIFRFVRDHFSEHIAAVVQWKAGKRTLRTLFKWRIFRWFTFILGGFVIASPLPDELGISLLGFTKMNTRLFVIVSFIFNFIGIIFLGATLHWALY